jgi:hypothetical protein
MKQFSDLTSRFEHRVALWTRRDTSFHALFHQDIPSLLQANAGYNVYWARAASFQII